MILTDAFSAAGAYGLTIILLKQEQSVLYGVEQTAEWPPLGKSGSRNHVAPGAANV